MSCLAQLFFEMRFRNLYYPIRKSYKDYRLSKCRYQLGDLSVVLHSISSTVQQVPRAKNRNHESMEHIQMVVRMTSLLSLNHLVSLISNQRESLTTWLSNR